MRKQTNSLLTFSRHTINSHLRKLLLFLLIISVISLSGCETIQEHKGTAIGSAIGLTIGSLACDKYRKSNKNKYRNCMAGFTVAGATVGYLWDRREKKLKELARQQNIDLEINNVETFNNNSSKRNGIEVAVKDTGMFNTGSSTLKPTALPKIRAIADVYVEEPKTVLVIGHTDAVGSERTNLRLSEQRAKTVAKILASRGVPRNQLYFQGAGESQPIDSNDTDIGRSNNRRVEIVEVDSVDSIAAYSLQRKSDSRFIKHSNKTAAEKQKIERERKPIETAKTPIKNEIPSEQEDSTVGTNEAAVNLNERSAIAKVVDFDGSPANSGNIKQIASAGRILSKDKGRFALISSAFADKNTRLSPCYLSSPRNVGDVVNLNDGKILDLSKLQPRDYWPGLNGNAWTSEINGHLLGLKGLRVIAETGNTVGSPELLIYEKYTHKLDNPDYRYPLNIESYVAEKGLLIRSFLRNGSAIKCMDIVMPLRTQKTAIANILYYDTNIGVYEKDFSLSRAVRKTN